MTHAIAKSELLGSFPHCCLLPVTFIIRHSILVIVECKVTSSFNLVEEINFQIRMSFLRFDSTCYLNLLNPAQIYRNLSLRFHCVWCACRHFVKDKLQLALHTLAYDFTAVYRLIGSLFTASLVPVNCKEYICGSFRRRHLS